MFKFPRNASSSYIVANRQTGYLLTLIILSSVSLRPACARQSVLGHPGLQSTDLVLEKETKKNGRDKSSTTVSERRQKNITFVFQEKPLVNSQCSVHFKGFLHLAQYRWESSQNTQQTACISPIPNLLPALGGLSIWQGNK